MSFLMIDYGCKITFIVSLCPTPMTYQVLTKNLFSLNADED